jgi:hypothetical protein
MANFLQTKSEDLGKLLIRIAVGGIMIFHGVFKLTHGVDWIKQMLGGLGLPCDNKSSPSKKWEADGRLKWKLSFFLPRWPSSLPVPANTASPKHKTYGTEKYRFCFASGKGEQNANVIRRYVARMSAGDHCQVAANWTGRHWL